MNALTYSNLTIVDPKKDRPYIGGIVIKDSIISDIGAPHHRRYR